MNSVSEKKNPSYSPDRLVCPIGCVKDDGSIDTELREELAQRGKEGCSESRALAIETIFGLIVNKANMYYQAWEHNWEELVQAMSLQVCKAFESWNPEKGTWGTYAHCAVASGAHQWFVHRFAQQRDPRREARLGSNCAVNPDDRQPGEFAAVDARLDLESVLEKGLLPGDSEVWHGTIEYMKQGYTSGDYARATGKNRKSVSSSLHLAKEKIKSRVTYDVLDK